MFVDERNRKLVVARATYSYAIHTDAGPPAAGGRGSPGQIAAAFSAYNAAVLLIHGTGYIDATSYDVRVASVKVGTNGHVRRGVVFAFGPRARAAQGHAPWSAALTGSSKMAEGGDAAALAAAIGAAENDGALLARWDR